MDGSRNSTMSHGYPHGRSFYDDNFEPQEQDWSHRTAANALSEPVLNDEDLTTLTLQDRGYRSSRATDDNNFYASSTHSFFDRYSGTTRTPGRSSYESVTRPSTYAATVRSSRASTFNSTTPWLRPRHGNEEEEVNRVPRMQPFTTALAARLMDMRDRDTQIEMQQQKPGKPTGDLEKQDGPPTGRGPPGSGKPGGGPPGGKPAHAGGPPGGGPPGGGPPWGPPRETNPNIVQWDGPNDPENPM